MIYWQIYLLKLHVFWFYFCMEKLQIFQSHDSVFGTFVLPISVVITSPHPEVRKCTSGSSGDEDQFLLLTFTVLLFLFAGFLLRIKELLCQQEEAFIILIFVLSFKESSILILYLPTSRSSGQKTFFLVQIFTWLIKRPVCCFGGSWVTSSCLSVLTVIWWTYGPSSFQLFRIVVNLTPPLQKLLGGSSGSNEDVLGWHFDLKILQCDNLQLLHWRMTKFC